MKLTLDKIEKLKAPTSIGKPSIVWDSDLRGFGVLLSGKTNSKTYVAQRRMPNGKTRRVTVGQVGEFKKVEQARDRAGELLAKLRQGIEPRVEQKKEALGAVTLGEALEAYVKANADRRREKTIAEYQKMIRRHLAGWLRTPLRAIDPDMVRERHAEIKKEVTREHAKHDRALPYTGAASANVAMRDFSVVYNWAREKGDGRDFPKLSDLPPNPMTLDRDDLFKVQPRTRRVRPDQMVAFYKAVDALENRTARDYVLLLLFTGFRRNEAAALKWSEIDFTARTITLPRERTKADRALELPMCSFVRELLIARQSLGREKSGYVFGAGSESGHIEEPRFAFDVIAEACGIRVSPHDMRRTFITAAESADISWAALKALVNHAPPQGVTGDYLTLTTERLREPTQMVCDHLMALCGIKPPKDDLEAGRKRRQSAQ